MSILDKARQMAATVVRLGVMARSAANGYDQADFRGAALGVRRLQPYGLRSRAPEGSLMVIVAVNGGRSNVAYLAAEKPGQGPTDLEEGEVALYNGASPVLTVRLTKDGDILVIPASGRKVKLGDKDDTKLDAVVLYTGLKAQFDAFVSHYNVHTHTPGGVLFDSTGKPCTGSVIATPDTATPLSSAAASPSVVGQKP